MTQIARTRPSLSQARLEAYAASAVAWLVRLLGVLIDPSAPRRRRRLLDFVRRGERWVECIIFLQAVRAFGPPPQRRRAPPRAAPPGFRRKRRTPQRVWKLARIRADRRASLVDRIAQLLTALANPAPYRARFTAQLCKGLRLSALVPYAPPPLSLAAAAPCAPVAFADSS
jgi:hypothetical protein